MVKKTIGFSWGPAGTGCSYWTGVRMSHILRICGVDEEREVLQAAFANPFLCVIFQSLSNISS